MSYAIRLQPMASDGTEHDERGGRAAAELKETEDLLAGFDRPGRTPRAPPAARDFVDYHLGKGRSSPEARRAARSPDVARRHLPTAIIPGHTRRTPPWAPWAAMFLVMAAGGIGVAAFVSTPPSAPTPPASLAANATTLAPSPPAVDPTSGPARDIPPPPPPNDSVEPSATDTAETTSADAPRVTSSPPSATAASAPRRPPAVGTETPPSVAPTEPAPAPTNVTPSADFIRTL